MTWPAIVRPLIEQYGPGPVESAALAELGYPASWIHTFTETSRVQAALTRE